MNLLSAPIQHFRQMRLLALLVGAVALIALLGLGVFFGMAQAARALHFAHVIGVSAMLGGVFLILVLAVTGAKWSDPAVPFAEGLAFGAVLLFVLQIIDFAGFRDVYTYTHAAEHHVSHHRLQWMNPVFWLVRDLVVLGVFAWIAVTWGGRGGAASSSPLNHRAAPLLIVLGLGGTVLAFDLGMSLNPIHASTIYGIHFLTLSAAFGAGLWNLLTSQAATKDTWRTDAAASLRHDQSKLLWTLLMFNVFVSFVEYYITYSANIPEETSFYRIRREGGWDVAGWVLVAAQAAVPFFAFMRADVRRSVAGHRLFAAWAVFACLVHLAWLVLPEFHAHLAVTPMALLALLTVSSFLAAAYFHQLQRRGRLQESAT